jgi:hypothetical protein
VRRLLRADLAVLLVGYAIGTIAAWNTNDVAVAAKAIGTIATERLWHVETKRVCWKVRQTTVIYSNNVQSSGQLRYIVAKGWPEREKKVNWNGKQKDYILKFNDSRQEKTGNSICLTEAMAGFFPAVL